MSELRAGALDRRVTLRAKSLANDASGQAIETWADLATVWAEKRDLRGREYLAAQAVNAEVETLFRIRWRSDVTPANRLTYDGKDYDIAAVAEIGRREGLELRCTARAD